jgi:hypothetical protein
MPKFNVTMYEERIADAIIEAKNGKEAKDIALKRREELFDFDSVFNDALYQVGEAEYIPPDESEE